MHIDSHADLGLGYLSWTYILDDLLQYPVEERRMHTKYLDCFGQLNDVGIGDYLLYAIAFCWINSLTYCANPNGDKNDYVWETLKDFEENSFGTNRLRIQYSLCVIQIWNFLHMMQINKKSKHI